MTANRPINNSPHSEVNEYSSETRKIINNMLKKEEKIIIKHIPKNKKDIKAKTEHEVNCTRIKRKIHLDKKTGQYYILYDKAIYYVRPISLLMNDEEMYEWTTVNEKYDLPPSSIDVYKVQLVKEKLETDYYSNIRVTNPSRVVQVFKKFIKDYSDRECFVVIGLNLKNKITGINLVSIGGLRNAIVSIPNVFKAAILNNSQSIVLAHNHPSGDPEPSNEDKTITNRIIKAGKTLSIQVMDHLVVGEDSYYSFKEHNNM